MLHARPPVLFLLLLAIAAGSCVIYHRHCDPVMDARLRFDGYHAERLRHSSRVVCPVFFCRDSSVILCGG